VKVILRRRLGWSLVIAAVFGVIWGSNQQLPFVIVEPGPAYNVLDLEDGKQVIEVHPILDENNVGVIDVLTVYESGSPGNTPYFWQLFAAFLSEEKAIYPLDLVYPGGMTLDDEMKESTQAFIDSQKKSLAAAATVLPSGTLETHKVTFGLTDVGGPSGGLAFTLGIIDKLSEGSITGGKRIAVTGTIEADGSVGPIGGIQQKIYSATKATDQFMVIPLENCEELSKSHLAKIRVIPVASLSDALSVLRTISADGDVGSLAVCPAK
jgi:PDZ domain-containing protein